MFCYSKDYVVTSQCQCVIYESNTLYTKVFYCLLSCSFELQTSLTLSP